MDVITTFFHFLAQNGFKSFFHFYIICFALMIAKGAGYLHIISIQTIHRGIHYIVYI